MNIPDRCLLRAAALAALLMLALLPLAAAAQARADLCEPRCENGGTCSRLFDDFKCKCPPGFSGFWCQFQSGGSESPRPAAQDLHALFLFTNVDRKPDLQAKFSICIDSLFRHLELPADTQLTLHFVADPGSKAYGEKLGNCSTPIPELQSAR